MAALGALLVAWSFQDTVFTLSPPTGQLTEATAQPPKAPVEPPVVPPPDKTAQQRPSEGPTAASADPFARLQEQPPPEDGLANSPFPLAMLEAAPAPAPLLPAPVTVPAPTPAAAPDKSKPPAPPPVKVAKQARPPTQPGDKRAARANTDPDVELIGALMRHLGTESAAANARPPQTIADMVKSCQGPDPIETLMCQRRICAGSWGKAEACPLSRAPQTGTPSRPPT